MMLLAAAVAFGAGIAVGIHIGKAQEQRRHGIGREWLSAHYRRGGANDA